MCFFKQLFRGFLTALLAVSFAASAAAAAPGNAAGEAWQSLPEIAVADLPREARETLALVCFLGYILFFVESRPWLMLAAGVMTHLVIPTGGLWLLLWPAAVILLWRPVPWRMLVWAGAILALAGSISILLPRLIGVLGLPFPGNEFGADNIVTRLRFVSFEDWGRVAFWAVPVGILPALFLLTWRWQDRLSRALTLVAVVYFLFFYVQAYRVLLHHFIPAMIPPLIVMWRSPLMQDARLAVPLRGLAAALLAVSAWLSWPEMKMHSFERVIGQHVLTEGPVFDVAPRGDGDRWPGFDQKGLDVAHVLLGKIFAMSYGEDDPKMRFFGAPLVWWYYAQFPRPAGQVINYIVKPLSAAKPEDGEAVATEQGYGLFIRDPELHRQHAQTRLPVDTGAAIYVTPRTVLYGHGVRTLDGRRVFDLVPPIKRMLGLGR
jgi:hypothetical protein